MVFEVLINKLEIGSKRLIKRSYKLECTAQISIVKDNINLL